MIVDRRILIASVAAFAAAPAIAAETPAGFVKRLYAPNSSPDMPIYAPALRAEISALSRTPAPATDRSEELKVVR